MVSVAAILYFTPGVAVKLVVIGWFVCVASVQRICVGVLGGVPILIVFVAGKPSMPFWVGVILMSHAPGVLKLIVQVAVFLFVVVFVEILQAPLVFRASED